MAFRICCLLVLVAVIWVPSLARGGDINMQVKQGGDYVQPKQGGDYVEPKQASCGGKLIVDNSGTTISSPGYPNNYNNKDKCVWRIKAENPEDLLEVTCDEFDLVESPPCKDRLLIIESRETQKFCGKASVSYYSIGNVIKIKFLTNKKDTSKGFSCSVRSFTQSTTAAESTEGVTEEDTENTEENAEETTKSPNTSETCKCGVANPSRIVGGQEVDPTHKYPWQVGLKIRGGSNYWCGGSIINTDYVMTAAHCFFDIDGNRESDEGLVVGVADHDMFSTDDDVSGVTRLVDVEKVILHPDYSPSGEDYDIALLKLKEKLDLSEHKQLRAVCLPADDSKTYEGVMATASGWGDTESDGSQSPVLLEVSVPILNPACGDFFDITERMLCAGLEEGGKDTCQGDSGGPLYVNESDRYVQVGITSWGYGCADANSPGVYARVSKFLSWIKSNTADGTYCQ